MKGFVTLISTVAIIGLTAPIGTAVSADMQRSQDRTMDRDLSNDRTLDRDMSRDRAMDRDLSGDRDMDRDRTMDRDLSGDQTQERDRDQVSREPGDRGGISEDGLAMPMDRNGDAMISRDELRSQNRLLDQLQDGWDQADTNGDGRIDRAEFSQFMEQSASPSGAEGE